MSFALYSCSSDECISISEEYAKQEQEAINSDKVLIANVQKARDYSKALFSFQTTTSNMEDMVARIDSKLLEQTETTLRNNIEMAINNDIFFLFKENGLNENLGLAILDYYENYEFIEIVKKYNLSNEEIQIFANMSECLDFLKKESIQTRGAALKTTMCALAVVGSIGTTISATAIATPVGLAGWVFFKAVSLASIVGCAA